MERIDIYMMEDTDNTWITAEEMRQIINACSSETEIDNAWITNRTIIRRAISLGKKCIIQVSYRSDFTHNTEMLANLLNYNDIVHFLTTYKGPYTVKVYDYDDSLEYFYVHKKVDVTVLGDDEDE